MQVPSCSPMWIDVRGISVGARQVTPRGASQVSDPRQPRTPEEFPNSRRVVLHGRTDRIGGRLRRHSGTLNCDWLPRLRWNSTNSRATASAMPLLRSSSTSPTARFISAVTPPMSHSAVSREDRVAIDVELRVPSDQLLYADTVGRGPMPIYQPAAASRNTPLHKEQSPRAPAPVAAIQPTSAAS
jgi:hypothetical protein